MSEETIGAEDETPKEPRHYKKMDVATRLRIVEMYTVDGKSIREIGVVVDRTFSTVHKTLVKEGIPLRGRGRARGSRVKED